MLKRPSERITRPALSCNPQGKAKGDRETVGDVKLNQISLGIEKAWREWPRTGGLGKM
jgi:hypothetical protein